jgi:hypothetical protein
MRTHDSANTSQISLMRYEKNPYSQFIMPARPQIQKLIFSSGKNIINLITTK